MRPVILSLITLALLFSACAEGSSDPARELQGAQELLAAEKWDEAYAEYKGFAEERNNHLAQFTLGMFHRLGWGRPVDDKAAFTWFERAAEGDIPVALHYVAEYLLEGVVSDADPVRAARLLEQAAALGHILSDVTLAELYFTGNGVPKDVKKGIALCQMAAKKGAIAAQFRMGTIYLEGKVAPQDYAAAKAWLEQAAGAGHAEARYRLGLMARQGLGQVPNVQTARYWFESAGELGYAPAYLPTAELYFGNGDERPSPDDLAKAYLWATAATRRPVDGPAGSSAEALRARILKIMPPDWQADLDTQVEAHLAEHRTD